MKVILSLSIICAVMLSSCGGPTLQSTDLSEYSVPLTIMAPADIKVRVSEGSYSTSLYIKSGNYKIDIDISNATRTENESKLSSMKINDLDTKDLIINDPNGYVYQKKWNGALTDYYEFNYYRVIEGKRYKFYPGTLSKYSKADAIKYYNALKNK